MRTRVRRRLPLLIFLVASIAALGWQLARNPSHEEREISQERLDRASLSLEPGLSLAQTFFSEHAGLKAIEVLLVRYDPEQELPLTAHLQLTLERLDRPGESPTVVDLPAVGLTHNQRLRFAFSPLLDSAGARYRLSLSSDGAYALGFWTCETDAYADGELYWRGVKEPGDLYFTTHYDYSLRDALRELGGTAWSRIATLPGVLLLLLLPGFVLSLYLLPGARLDLGSYLAMVLALSLATWPLLLLWSSLLGLSLAGWRIWPIVVALLFLGLYRLTKHRGALPMRWAVPGEDHLPELALAIILLLVLGTRLLQARLLVVPAWVDSVHHTLITQMISRLGAVPRTFEPYLAVGGFHYHFGFHANAAILTWLTGLQPSDSVLLLGQLLNGLCALSLYGLAARWTQQRWAGVGAAVIVGALSYMPAYYVSWGRYTQLTGLLMLAPLLLAASWLFDYFSPSRGTWLATSILLAGLALTHYRVLVFFAIYLVCYACLYLWRGRARRVAWQHLGRTGFLLAAVTLLLILPWAVRFAARVLPQVGNLYGGWAASEAQGSSFPVALLDVGWTRRLLYLAGAGAVWAILRGGGELILVPFWVALCLVMANPHWLGLRDLWLIHNESVAISFWLPAGLLGGWIVADLVGLIASGLGRFVPSIEWRRIFSWMSLYAAVALTAWGSWRMVDVVNPATIFVRADDLRAIAWVREHVQTDARILINARRWQGDLWVGADGGYWLPILAERETTMPAVFYAQGPESYRQGITSLAEAVEEAESMDDPELRSRLLAEGVTHLFVGAQGGRMLPKDLDPSAYYALLYKTGPVRVYTFLPEGG